MSEGFRQKNAILFVLITVMINAIGFGILIPVLPELLKELTGLDNSGAAIHGGRLTLVFAFMQFLCMPIIGALSDAYGRRPVMLVSLFGLSLDFFIMGLAPTIAFLYIGRLIAGALGATFSTASAYIADISPPETRAQNFGLIGASFGAGFMFGPVIGGFFGEFGPRIPFYAAGVIALINVIYGYFFLPETLEPEHRRPFSWKRANPFGAVMALGRISGARSLIFILFLLGVAHTAYPAVYTFTMMEKLGWTPRDVGLSLGVSGLTGILVQGYLIRIIIPRTGLFWAGVLGMVCAAGAYLGIGFATAGWMIYAIFSFSAFGNFYNPALNNMMSSRLPKSEQGELQGAIGAAQGFALMIGPIALTWIFSHYTADETAIYSPGSPFLVAGVLSLIALVLFVIVTDKKDRQVELPKAEKEAGEPMPPVVEG